MLVSTVLHTIKGLKTYRKYCVMEYSIEFIHYFLVPVNEVFSFVLCLAFSMSRGT